MSNVDNTKMWNADNMLSQLQIFKPKTELKEAESFKRAESEQAETLEQAESFEKAESEKVESIKKVESLEDNE